MIEVVICILFYETIIRREEATIRSYRRDRTTLKGHHGSLTKHKGSDRKFRSESVVEADPDIEDVRA